MIRVTVNATTVYMMRPISNHARNHNSVSMPFSTDLGTDLFSLTGLSVPVPTGVDECCRFVVERGKLNCSVVGLVGTVLPADEVRVGGGDESRLTDSAWCAEDIDSRRPEGKLDCDLLLDDARASSGTALETRLDRLRDRTSSKASSSAAVKSFGTMRCQKIGRRGERDVRMTARSI